MFKKSLSFNDGLFLCPPDVQVAFSYAVVKGVIKADHRSFKLFSIA
jgi:hypothetical protein